MSTLCAIAQEGLSVNRFFTDNLQDKSPGTITSVVITGEQLAKHNLSVYRSVSVTGDEALTAQMERAVTHDGVKAKSREVSLKNGRLYFGFYTLTPAGKENRYLFYLDNTITGGNKTMIIYMQGTATQAQISEMIKR